MVTASTKKITESIFLKMHPFNRVVVSLVPALIAYLLVRKSFGNALVTLMIAWDVFALSLTILSWIVFFTRSTEGIRRFASKDDGSLVYVFILIGVSSFASMFTVLLLITSKEMAKTYEVIYLVIGISGMLLSWVVLHTTFAFRYAHIYYDDDEQHPEKHAAGLDFPSEKRPDYIDFAYFSFVIGMTFQVSDVEISSRRIRRLALVHGLLSFAMNTFVVALTINIVAGLKG